MGKKPIVLLILDGFGYSEKKKGNAIAAAHTPNIDSYFRNYEFSLLDAHGKAVGLPEGTLGGSEVGHMHIGAGRHIYQYLTLIDKKIENGGFFRDREINTAIKRSKGGNLHLLGLLSDGGVHSHIRHLFALLELAGKKGQKNVYIHCILDGRDVPPKSAGKYLKELQSEIKRTGVGKIATVSGRYYTMDRDGRWDRTEKGYNAMVLGEGERAETAEQALKDAYGRGESDEFVLPTIVDTPPRISDGDSVIFYNFRADRARQITHAFVDNDFQGFNRQKHPNVYFLCFTQYDREIDAPFAFSPMKVNRNLVQVLSSKGLKILKAAETEKYAHVTFFFNSGIEKPFPGEERILIHSPKVATYDLKPEMSVYEITDSVLKEIEKDKFDFIVINFANCDMVGHTGVFDAAVKAVEAVDECAGRVVDRVLEKKGTVVLTADHGNAEEMLTEHNETVTAHSLNSVPFFIISERKYKLKKEGELGNVAPTILELFGIKKPKEMTMDSLILDSH